MNVSREKSGMLKAKAGANQSGSRGNKSSLHAQRIPSEAVLAEYNLGTSPRHLNGAIDMLSFGANSKIVGIKSPIDNSLYTDQTLFAEAPAKLVKIFNIVNS